MSIENATYQSNMVVSNRIRGAEPPGGKTAAPDDKQHIRNDVSAQKQTIGIPRAAASRNIVRELRELDEAIQSVGRVDDDGSTGGESQRDEYLHDTPVVEPVVGRSSSSRVSRRSHRSSSLEEAVKKTVLLAVTIENNGSSSCVRNNNHKLPSPDIDFILSDLNRAVPQGEKSPTLPMTPRYRPPVTSRATSKELASSSNLPPHMYTESIKEEEETADKKTAVLLENSLEDWNPFDSSTCITSWASDVKFTESSFEKPFADFENAFVITSQLSI